MLYWFASGVNKHKSHPAEDIYKAMRDLYISDGYNKNIDTYGIMKSCLSKLIKDDNVQNVVVSFKDLDTQEESTQDQFIITFDGLLLCETGGYDRKYKKERRQELFNKRIVWATIIVAVCGVIAQLISSMLTPLFEQNYKPQEQHKEMKKEVQYLHAANPMIVLPEGDTLVFSIHKKLPH